MPEICEFLDLLNEERDIPPEQLQYPLGQMAAEGITRLREDEIRRSMVTFEEYVKDQMFKARKEGEEEGREEGKAIGEAKTKDLLIQKLMQAQNLTRQEAESILL